MSNSSHNWCPEIFRNVYIDRVNDDGLQVAPCCQAQSVKEDVARFNFYTNSYLQSLRQEFAKGLKPKACNKCWSVESLGHKSRRQSAIEFYGLEINDQQVIFEGLDHNVTWACNLACIMCGPHNSSTWASELSMTQPQLASIGKSFQKKNRFLEQLDIADLKKLHFNGGEPLINDDQTLLLQKLDDHNVLANVFLSYNTNASVLPSDKLLNLWKKARLVKLFFSIDGTQSAFDYIRWPAKWKNIENNMLLMKSALPSNVMFGLNVTVGAYNIFEIKDVKIWFDENLLTNREGDSSDFNWQIAANLDPKWLRQDVKTLAIDHLKDTIKGVANYLESCINYPRSDQWIDLLHQIDRRRSLHWQKHLMVGKYYQ